MADVEGLKERFEEFVSLHRQQLTSCGIPSECWRTLYHKLHREIFDAGTDFQLMKVEYEDSSEIGWKVVVCNPAGVTNYEGSIYLVDHAWTFDQSCARRMLSTRQDLLDRVCSLMDIEASKISDVQKVDLVMDKIWCYSQTYSFGGTTLGSEESLPLWYILDEFGSRIQHSDSPSAKMVPFHYLPTQTTYSVFWPIKTLYLHDELTRDYIPHIPLSNELKRLAHLLPWNPCDFTEIDEIPDEPDDSYFQMSRFDKVNFSSVMEPTIPQGRQLLVWTSDPLVEKYLTCEKFRLTENRDEADIIWQNEHIRDFAELSQRNVLLSQFPYENLLTTKDLLAIVSRRAAPTASFCPRWLPVTYNLNTELPEFLCHFQKRQQNGENNIWIAKPWNLGRGLGHVITGDVNCLVRLPESGPYIVSKYLEDPVLFDRPDGIDGVKFDFRYMVLLKSIKPLKLSCYKTFFLRFANKSFNLKDYHDYEKHFTVHNYTDPNKLLNLNCEDFVPEWDKQYPTYPWSIVETDTMQCILELFEAVSCRDPPRGMTTYPQSRAHYAIDLMVKWDTDSQGRKTMVPQILELNFVPDNARGCRNYPDFYNDIFTALYLGDGSAQNDTEIVIA